MSWWQEHLACKNPAYKLFQNFTACSRKDAELLKNWMSTCSNVLIRVLLLNRKWHLVPWSVWHSAQRPLLCVLKALEYVALMCSFQSSWSKSSRHPSRVSRNACCCISNISHDLSCDCIYCWKLVLLSPGSVWKLDWLCNCWPFVLRSQIITSPPVQRQSIVMTCLSVCLSVHEHISGSTSPIFTRFLLSPDSECGVWDEHVCVSVLVWESEFCYMLVRRFCRSRIPIW